MHENVLNWVREKQKQKRFPFPVAAKNSKIDFGKKNKFVCNPLTIQYEKARAAEEILRRVFCRFIYFSAFRTILFPETRLRQHFPQSAGDASQAYRPWQATVIVLPRSSWAICLLTAWIYTKDRLC